MVTFTAIMEPIAILKQHPQLRLFLSTRFLFILALQMVNMSVGWYLYEITGNALSLGWVGLSEVVPAIGLALYAGHVIDKSDKRTMLLRGICCYLLAVIGLGQITASYFLPKVGLQTTELLIYLFIFFTGIFRAFTGPTFHAIIAQLVPKTDLPKAITYSTTAWQLAAVTGPVLAGSLIAFTNISVMFTVSIILVSIAAILISRLPKLPVQHLAVTQRTWESVKEGIRFVLHSKQVFGALSVDMFAVLFGGATAMLPVFAKDILHVDANGMGLLKSAQGIGTIAMLFWLTKYPLKNHQGQRMLQCVALFGLCIIVFAISQNFWLSFFALLFSGVFDALSMVVRSTILQMYVPDDMRGRVSAVNSMFVNSSNELGQFESGIAAKWMGTVPSVIFGGCMTLLVVSIAWVKAPTLRKLTY